MIAIAFASIAILIGLVLWAFQLMEYARRKTEKAIAIFYRDRPVECVMFLNKISIEETKKEIARQTMLNEESNKQLQKQLKEETND
jgi:hypothetical protein